MDHYKKRHVNLPNICDGVGKTPKLNLYLNFLLSDSIIGTRVNVGRQTWCKLEYSKRKIVILRHTRKIKNKKNSTRIIILYKYVQFSHEPYGIQILHIDFRLLRTVSLNVGTVLVFFNCPVSKEISTQLYRTEFYTHTQKRNEKKKTGSPQSHEVVTSFLSLKTDRYQDDGKKKRVRLE